jgi:hypothetical protein
MIREHASVIRHMYIACFVTLCLMEALKESETCGLYF